MSGEELYSGYLNWVVNCKKGKIEDATPYEEFLKMLDEAGFEEA